MYRSTSRPHLSPLAPGVGIVSKSFQPPDQSPWRPPMLLCPMLIGALPFSCQRWNHAAAGRHFTTIVRNQCAPVHVHGILAAYRCKQWVLAQGWRISLGTVGVERWWWNTQQRAINKCRSHSTESTVNLLLILRWIYVNRRRLHGTKRGDDATETWQGIALDAVAQALVADDTWDVPLAKAYGSPFAAVVGDSEVCRIYGASSSCFPPCQAAKQNNTKRN